MKWYSHIMNTPSVFKWMLLNAAALHCHKTQNTACPLNRAWKQKYIFFGTNVCIGSSRDAERSQRSLLGWPAEWHERREEIENEIYSTLLDNWITSICSYRSHFFFFSILSISLTIVSTLSNFYCTKMVPRVATWPRRPIRVMLACYNVQI